MGIAVDIAIFVTAGFLGGVVAQRLRQSLILLTVTGLGLERPAKAARAFATFLDMWSAADTGIPQVEDARERLFDLRGRFQNGTAPHGD